MYRKKTFGRHPVKIDKFGKQMIVTEELLWDEDIVTAWDYIAELPAGLIPHKGLKGDQMELALLADGYVEFYLILGTRGADPLFLPLAS